MDVTVVEGVSLDTLVDDDDGGDGDIVGAVDVDFDVDIDSTASPSDDDDDDGVHWMGECGFSSDQTFTRLSSPKR